MVVVGWVVAKMAARNAESYFLAGKSLPWWIIGVAHGSSGVDITGTMWFVMMLFIYGVKGVWLLWVWPLFNVIFRMMYLGTWVRRSNVLTGAEWMRTRFGHSRGAELAYLSVVVYALVSVVGFLSYAFRGIGKFTEPFFPSRRWACRPLAARGCTRRRLRHRHHVRHRRLLRRRRHVQRGDERPDPVRADRGRGGRHRRDRHRCGPRRSRSRPPCPPAGTSSFFGWKLDLDWSNLIPRLQREALQPDLAGGDGYSLFGFFIRMLFLKGVLVSMAGPDAELRHPARPLDAQPARGGAREHGDGHGRRWPRGSC